MRLKAVLVVLVVTALFFGIVLTKRGMHPGHPVAAEPLAVSQVKPPPASAQNPQGTADPAKLPRPLDILWKTTPPEPAFAEFAGWTERYIGARDATLRRNLEGEGIALARKRLTEIADLIISDPQRALDRTIPKSIRNDLPASVRDLLEQPLNGKGDLEVVGILPLPGLEAETPPIVRTARINDSTYQAFTFGDSLAWVTRTGVPFNGISVPVTAATSA